LELEPAIAAEEPHQPRPGDPRIILLTGATGFLGAYLLRDLLAHTTATIVCLVRADSPAHGRTRIEDNLHHYGIAPEAGHWRRVEVQPGDLAGKHLGLPEADYTALAARVDTVIHGAATVNFYQTYRQLRGTNVGGCREILRFTVRHRLKALHYVSTTGVFDSDACRGVVVRETDAPAHCAGSVMGYTQTKWVAEQLVLTARARGIPAAIYRSPFIMGDSRSGIVDEENLVVKMLIGCIQGGAWPDEPTDVEMVPVDSLSRAIVHLSSHPANASRTFHVTSPQPMRWADIGLAARSYGYPLALPAYNEWKERLAKFARHKDNALRPLLRFYTKAPPRLAVPAPEVFTRPPRPIFNSTATQQALAPAGLVPPRMTHALFANYLDAIVRRGWLPAPADLPAKALARPAKSSGNSHPPYAERGPHA
jgi:thioester reductase-like protein